MDRYNDLKVLLKTWETAFLKQHHRKPNKADVETAPEGTQKLYKEYQALKQYREHNSSNSRSTAESNYSCQLPALAPLKTEMQTAEKILDPDVWGAHLNRGAETPKLTPRDCDSLKASAQYFGMKLKSNLCASMKERPSSLKKSFTPKWKPAIGISEAGKESATPTRNAMNSTSDGSLKHKPLIGSPSRNICAVRSTSYISAKIPAAGKPVNGSSDFSDRSSDSASPLIKMLQAEDDTHLDSDEDLPPLKLGFNLSKLNTSSSPSPIQLNKFQQLRSTVGQRMTSLDSCWLDRCQGIKGEVAGSPEADKTPTAATIKEWSEISSPIPTQPPPELLPSSASGVLKSPGHQIPTLNGCSPSLPIKRPLAMEESLESEGLSILNEDQPSEGFTIKKDKRGDGGRPEIQEKGKSTTKVTEQISSSLADESSTVTSNVPSSKCLNPSKRTLHSENHASLGNRVGGHVHEEERVASGNDTSLPKKAKRAQRKRQREVSDEKQPGEDKPLPEEGTAKKQRRTKVSTTPVEKSAPVRRRKAKVGKQSKEEDDEPLPTSTARKVTMPMENLMGDVEEELKSNSASRTATARPSLNHNPNFVRINLKNKSHVKGFALRGNHLRKQMWKQKYLKKGEQFGGGGSRHFGRSSDTCFRCGETGHWASDCKGKSVAPILPQENDAEEEEEITLPTLEEVARLTNTQLQSPAVPAGYEQSQQEPDEAEETPLPLDVVRPAYEPPVAPPPMEPFYPLGADGKVIETPREVFEALSVMGYGSFRPGQEVAIMRILSGQSTLVVLSTGMGKSLCYQLPAYLYAKRSKCITLVISPLVSLMDDQVSGLPPQLKAVCIHSNMTKTQRETAIEKVKEGSVHVLLLSPEALVGGGLSGSSCLPPADQLPPVAFACIDEAHCVSEWSHNFRPCYLRLCKVLRDRLGVRCMLGLTATATLATAQDISHHLGVSEEEEGGIAVRSAAVPSNLHLSVSMDREKDQALVSLLKGERFSCLDSVIIYCTRREETERMAALLRTCLQGLTLKEATIEEGVEEDFKAKRKKAEAKKKIRKPLKWISDSYHAGMSAAQRRRVQNNFMSGQLRIVVATVAFGMGLDKSDVRGIVHYNMPKNFESYVQEIGRAGRDGKPAHCHLFLDPEGGDLNELRRHIYADTVDYFTIKKLVQKVFPRCKCREIHKKSQALNMGEVDDGEMMDFLEQCEEPSHGPAKQSGADVGMCKRVCYKHERAIPIEPTVQALDVREEGIETLLCYLELHPQNWLEMLHPTLSSCRVVCYGGPQQLRTLAKRCPPIAVCLARERMAGKEHTHCSEVEFNVVELADSMGWEVLPVKRALRQLQWNTEFQKGFRGTGKSGIISEFSNLSFHLRSYGDLSDEDLDKICEFLHHKVVAREKAALYQLQACFKAFQSVAFRSCSRCADEVHEERSMKLKAQLLEYFEKKLVTDENGIRVFSDHEEDEDESDDLGGVKLRDWESQIRADIRQFLSIRHEEKFSGRALARIFHGIGSPCYPPQVYGRDRRYWRKYIHFDFNELIRLSTDEIIRWK